MTNNRTSSRFTSYAKVLMDGIPGYMRDISEDGFKYVTIIPLTVEQSETKAVTVLPENEEISQFGLTGQIRWIRSDDEGFQICGIKILRFETPEGEGAYKELKRLFSS